MKVNVILADLLFHSEVLTFHLPMPGFRRRVLRQPAAIGPAAVLRTRDGRGAAHRRAGAATAAWRSGSRPPIPPRSSAGSACATPCACRAAGVFTAHEVRLAQAIGSVLAARYQAISTPRIIAERGELFRGQIEDRFVSAFLDERAATRSTTARRVPIACRDGRDASRRRAFELREPADLHRRAAARHDAGSAAPRGRACAPFARWLDHRVADLDQELLPPGRWHARCSSPMPRGGCSTSSASIAGDGRRPPARDRGAGAKSYEAHALR